MFYYISGKLAKLDGSFAVVDAGGVGFKMTISKSTYYRLSGTNDAHTVKLYTYMAVREDGTELFGFATEEELSAFKLLITVSGVGPKAAISILSTLTPEKLALAICTEDKKATIPSDFLVKRFLVSISQIFTVQRQSLSSNLTVRGIIPKKESNTMKKEPLFLKNTD